MSMLSLHLLSLCSQPLQSQLFTLPVTQSTVSDDLLETFFTSSVLWKKCSASVTFDVLYTKRSRLILLSILRQLRVVRSRAKYVRFFSTAWLTLSATLLLPCHEEEERREKEQDRRAWAVRSRARSSSSSPAPARTLRLWGGFASAEQTSATKFQPLGNFQKGMGDIFWVS